MPRPVSLTYAFDAYCGWCYGFGPALHQFADANSSRIKLRVLSGGLFIGTSARRIASFPHIPAANRRVTELTGVAFGDGYNRILAEGTTVMDSVDAAAGLIALRKQDANRVLAFTEAIQSAWFIEGRSLSDPQVYVDVAAAAGLDHSAVAGAFADPATLAEVESEFREVHRLGVDSYPTLLLHTKEGKKRLGGPLSSATALTRLLNEQLSSDAA